MVTFSTQCWDHRERTYRLTLLREHWEVSQAWWHLSKAFLEGRQNSARQRKSKRITTTGKEWGNEDTREYLADSSC